MGWQAFIWIVLILAIGGLIMGAIALNRGGSRGLRGRRGQTGATGVINVLNDGLQFDNIQQQVKLNNYQNFLLTNLYTQLALGTPLPSIPTGRSITFQNMTAATTLDIYLTQGYPSAIPATIITGGVAVPPGSSVVWPVPITQGWNGNFTAFPSGTPSVAGATLAEFGLNQLWSGFTPPLRDTFDISTVPPGIGTLCNNGPHGFPPNTNNCVYFSRQSGFSTQQSFGYNVGIQIVPPSTGSLPSQIVTCTGTNGDSPNSIGFPNDTAFPKQQTIECLAAPQGNYTVNFLDPVVAIP
jgi:hypothetical protein